MKKLKFYTFLLSIATIVGFGINEKQFVIGNPAPDLKFNPAGDMFDEFSLSELKGKIVIIDLWATWCSPCYSSLRNLNNLQQEFKDDLFVVGISPDSEEKILAFNKKEKLNITLVGENKNKDIRSFDNNYEFKTFPHSIVIDKDGVIRAITNPANINKKVIQDLLNSKAINLKEKNDFEKVKSRKSELLFSEYGDEYFFEMYSREYNKPNMINLDDTEMIAYNISAQGMISLVNDNAKIFYSDALKKSKIDSLNDYWYSWKLTFHKDHKKEQVKKYGEFVKEIYGVNIKDTVVLKEVYKLTVIDSTLLKPSEPDLKQNPISAEGYYIHSNSTIRQLKNSLDSYNFKFYDKVLYDISQNKGSYNFNLIYNPQDINSINTALSEYGLRVIKMEDKDEFKALLFTE